MNIFYKAWQRTKMFFFYKATYLMHWRMPKTIKGENSLLTLPQKIEELGLKKPFLVFDPGVVKLGLADGLIKELERRNIKYYLFTQIEPNPNIADIECGVKSYHDFGADSIITMGGGSAMDTAKAIGARIARPRKSIEQLGGLLKVAKKIPMLIAIPTTAGTGSETTIAAIVTNKETHHKYAINDLNLVPMYAVLDPTLTVGLPNKITAMTGMDALTHAVEGFLSLDIPKKYRVLAKEAVNTIMHTIKEVYDNPTNIKARQDMLEASYKAGVVFTRVGLTYVHPIAHTLGGFYGVPHGLANAVVMPYCLKYYGEGAHKRLASLYDATFGPSSKNISEKANSFIEEIEKLNDYLSLSQKFEIKEEDIETMVKYAIKEANAAYFPVVLLDKTDIKNIINEIRK